jgi:hypothetical protein
MTLHKTIQTTVDYFENTMKGLPPATSFVLVLDPEGFLDLDQEYADLVNNKTWMVLKYNGNDFTLRRRYSAIKDKDRPLIIWVTNPSTNEQEKIDLSYIYDIVEKTEKVIDLSLQAILHELIHGVEWPEELYAYSKEIGLQLSSFYTLYHELRKELPLKAPLNANHVKAILVALRNPQISLSKLILGSTSTQESLSKYIMILLDVEISEKDRTLLREIIENNLLGDFSEISSWFKLEREELAMFFYLLDMAKRYGIPNPINQLRGMGLLSFDPETLGESNIAKAMTTTESVHDTKWQITKTAERTLDPQQIVKVFQCTNLQDPTPLSEAIQKERQPLIAYTLSVIYLKEMIKRKQLNSSNLKWTESLHIPILAEGMETAYSGKANDLLHLLQDVAVINQSLEFPLETKGDISPLVDWWDESGIFRLQLIMADLANYMQSIYDNDLRKAIDTYVQGLKQDVKKKLEKADLNLASIIERNWKGYLAHPRIATNILRDYILKKGLVPSKDMKIWILIFDGMRFDTWKEVVKPIISQKFEIREEKPYFSMLPSETDIARVAVLAGCPPNEWEDYDGGYTYDHNILASRFFGLSRYEGKEKLRVTVACETDVGQRRLDEGAYLYNVLIYNVSDDWVHDFRGDVRELNSNIEGTLRRTIMPDLERRIGDKDHVVLTSDHGFIELARDDELKVTDIDTRAFSPGAEKKIIAYRCLRNLECAKGYRISFTPHEFYTVAEGRRWFSRPRGKFSRYAHGGISLDEMVVPGIVLGKMAALRIELSLIAPDIIELTEDISSKLETRIMNNGNKETPFQLTLHLNTGEEERFEGSIRANESEVFMFLVEKPILSMKNLEIVLSWKGTDKGTSKLQKRTIPIKVKERKDKVEFKFGGLDKIME